MKTFAALAAAVALFAGADALAQQQTLLIKDAKPGEVRMLVTNSIRGPIEAVIAEASKAIGKPIVIQWGSARRDLKEEALSGQAFEVAMLVPDVDEDLLKAGKIMPGSAEIARVDVAIGLRGDATGLDVSTPAKLKEAMLKARSIKYSPLGAALMTVRKVLSTLQIADRIKDSSRASEPVVLSPGEYELNFYPLSEILKNKDLVNLGPVTRELQVPVIVTAVVGKKANDEKAARALIRFLQGPTIDAALASSGMTKGHAVN